MTRLFALLAALFALVAAASPAAAWWEYGHETVARIAYLEATPATRVGIDRLLRQSKLLDTPSCPARTIEQAAVWPDCVKTLGDRFSYAYNWHFVDIVWVFVLATVAVAPARAQTAACHKSTHAKRRR